MGGQGWASGAPEIGRDPGELLDSELAAMLAAATGPTNWRTIGSGDVGEAWTRLREWVDWFRREFSFDHRVVPPCWYRHPAMVSVLSALFDHWRSAHDPLNTPAGASEWHRVLMPLEQRLRDWASRTGCAAGAHRPEVAIEYPDDAAEWAAHVAADVDARRRQENAAADDAGQLFILNADVNGRGRH